MAQTDSLSKQELNVVTVTGTKKILFDPALRPRMEISGGNYSLAQSLQEQNLVFLKSYGPGLLSSILSRGTDPAHTPILWNGFSLQNSVNANPEPSIETIPNNYQAAYYPGGQSGLFGSGAMGGTVHISPSFSLPFGISASGAAEFGSFGRNSQNLNVGYQDEKTSVSAGFRLFKATNNFQFVNRAILGKPVQRLQHAEASGTSVNADFKYEVRKGETIMASVWYQFNHRQIPPTMLTSVSSGEQIDENVRSMIGWTKNIKRDHNLSIKTAFLYDYLFYNDNALTIPSLMVQYASLSRVEYDYHFLSNHAIFVGLNHSYYKTYMLEYHGVSPHRNQSALFVGYKYSLPKNLGEAAVQAVEEFTDGKFVPFCPSLSVLLKPKPFLPIRVRVNRNYRQPTFNDLYWVPGGNPNLKPELGFSQELGIGFEKKYTKKANSFNIAIYGTGFHNSMQNRIAWVPGPVFWSPVNIDRTRAYGAESDLKFSWKNKKWALNFTANYSYTKSIRTKERFTGDPAYKKQLIYMPEHFGGAGVEISYHKTSLYYRHRFTGKRYTLADNSRSIPGFQTGSIGISQTVTVYGINLKIWFTCDNIANVQYEVLEYRPMPGRNYRGGLTISFNKKIPKESHRPRFLQEINITE